MSQSLLENLPLNISLLVLTPENTKGMRPVSVMDIFEGGSRAFHPDGLFSVETFGKVGDERRNRLFGYVDLGAKILHPTMFKALVELKELYGDILAGKAYATFNKSTKDFDASNMSEGRTGYSFFMEHFHELKFEERKSTSREFNIRLINENRDKAHMSRLIVIPAGLRDFTIQDNGKPDEDKINDLYRKVIAISNVIRTYGAAADQGHADSTRYNLQTSVMEIYTYIVNLLQGKSKIIQGWWASRTIFNSTRNVITSNVSKTKVLGDPLTVSSQHTVAGLYQCMMAIFPIAVNLVRGYLTEIFPGHSAPARLVNKKTLQREIKMVSSEHFDDWMTQEGLESLFGKFEVEALRHDVIEIEGSYLALVYNDGVKVRLFNGIDELPEGWDKKHVSPVTYAELYYLSIQKRMKEIPVLVTRYPITGYGSIYPSMVYMKTTTRSKCLTLLDENWQETDEYANEFPIQGLPFVNSMSPARNNLGRLGADFDGDTCSMTAVMTDDGIEECRRHLASREFYVDGENKMYFSASNDVSDLVFSELTR